VSESATKRSRILTRDVHKGMSSLQFVIGSISVRTSTFGIGRLS
jgi:hypothetical protein